jgi:hypothetical protein
MARLVISGAVVFATLAGVVGVSRALFVSAPATATDSTFSTGSANLLIASDAGVLPGTYGASIPGANVTDMTPGEERTFTFWLKNDSPGNMELDLASDLADISLTPSTDLGTALSLDFDCDVKNSTNRDGETPVKNVNAWDADAAEPVDDPVDASTTRGQLGPSGAADGVGTDEAECVMTTALDSGSTAQSATASFDAVFTGTQVPPV